MLSRLENSNVKELLDGYFDTLSAVGYVKHQTVSKFLVLLFLSTFVHQFSDKLTEDDKNDISKVLFCLFGIGDCLFPYEIGEGYVKIENQ